LLATGNLDATQLKAAQADQDLYQRFGVDPIARQQALRFTISEQQAMTLTITSESPIVEPLLHLLLEIRWPGGQLFKELTVLLDPPTH
jgi:pilus assembly protein FimV